MHRPTTTFFALFLLFASLPALAQTPTNTEPQPVTETLHGVQVVDPFRWLEGSDAPEIETPHPALDARVKAWTKAQNAHTRQTLEALPGRDRLETRLDELLEVGSISTPERRGERYFHTERRGQQNQDVLYVRDGLKSPPRPLLDPNQVDATGLTTLSWFVPSHDGELLAFGLFQGGDENATLYVLRTANGEWLAEEIPGKVGPVNWLSDGSGFFYRRLADLTNPYSAQIKFHRLGTHHRQDPILFEQYKEGPLATTYGPYSFLDPESRWLGVMYHTGTQSNDLWFYDVPHWQTTGELRKVEVMMGEDAQNLAFVQGDLAFLHTTLDAPNGRLMAVDLNNPGREHWREIIPESTEGAVLQNVAPAGGQLVANWLHKASTKIELLDLEGKERHPLTLPGIGSAFVVSWPQHREAFVAFESYNEPRSIYRVDLESGERTLWARLDVPVDPEKIVVRQVQYPSKDGTQVSMFVIHRKGLELDGKNPTILFGYGGFSVSMQPRFSSRVVPWVEQGGVYAVANLRGGGEYGQSWHRDGMLDRKQNVFDDFIAAAEYLVAERYTNPQQLGIWGGSNGGLLTGAVLVQRPELFSAVISAVPLLDMLRYQHFLMARYWIPEYGSAENPEQLPYLLRYSPYQNVQADTPYPAVLLTAGENDARVHPLHARKMAARLQAATSSDPKKEPILLWVEGDVGHGSGKPVNMRRRDTADQLAFFAWQLGLEL